MLSPFWLIHVSKQCSEPRSFEQLLFTAWQGFMSKQKCSHNSQIVRVLWVIWSRTNFRVRWEHWPPNINKWIVFLTVGNQMCQHSGVIQEHFFTLLDCWCFAFHVPEDDWSKSIRTCFQVCCKWGFTSGRKWLSQGQEIQQRKSSVVWAHPTRSPGRQQKQEQQLSRDYLLWKIAHDQISIQFQVKKHVYEAQKLR